MLERAPGRQGHAREEVVTRKRCLAEKANSTRHKESREEPIQIPTLALLPALGCRAAACYSDAAMFLHRLSFWWFNA